jgi:cysteinyl-tRNA synthetase
MDLKSMKIKSSTVGSRSSEYIDETIKFIEKIMEKDYGYTSNSSVYFNLLKFYQEHGDLELSSYRTGDTGASSAAGAVPKLEMFDKEKQNQYDFMLWKRTNAGEPGFESPWGYGLPNSDIQCNVLAKTLFGKNSFS